MESKITKLNYSKSWTGSHGEMHTFDIEFENGDKGQVNAKSKEPKYKVGDSVNYTKTPNGEYPDRIKIEMQQGFQKKGSDRRAFALSYAKDIAVAKIEKGESMSTEKVFEIADKFFEWMEK